MKTSIEYVGILSPLDLLFTSLKREALLFDKIAIPNISHGTFFQSCPEKALDYLIEKGIVFDPVERYIGNATYLRKIGKDVYEENLKNIELREISLSRELAAAADIHMKEELAGLIELFSFLKKSCKYTLQSLELQIGIPLRKIGAMADLFFKQFDYDRRGIACDLRQNFGINAFPVATSSTIINDEFLNGKNDIVELTLQIFPEPDIETTTWEQIIDFRNDEDSKIKLLSLRNWINEIARREITKREFVENLEYLCYEYEQQMKLHKMKVNSGILETFFMITAEALEGILRLKPTQTIKTLFSVTHRKVKLLEAELNAHGREIAYVVKAREEFSTDKL
jgi:hypothetical protein